MFCSRPSARRLDRGVGLVCGRACLAVSRWRTADAVHCLTKTLPGCVGGTCVSGLEMSREHAPAVGGRDEPVHKTAARARRVWGGRDRPARRPPPPTGHLLRLRPVRHTPAGRPSAKTTRFCRGANRAAAFSECGEKRHMVAAVMERECHAARRWRHELCRVGSLLAAVVARG